MKTLKFLKYFLVIALGATLMFSCSDEEISNEELISQTDEIQLRTDESDPDCFVKLCVEFNAANSFNFTDIVTVDIPGVGEWSISDNEVTLPDGSTTPLINNLYCFSVPVSGIQGVTFDFHGYGNVNVTGEWANGAVCPLFAAEWPGTFKAPLNVGKLVKLTCESPCPPPPECFVEACITFIEGDPSDNYTLILPSVGNVSIANGTVTLPDNSQFQLPADGTFCVDLPIFDPVTATVIYNGTGSVTINATWEDNTSCEIFSAGECSDDFVHVTQEVTISCVPSCPPAPECFVEACITFIAGSPSDNYTLILPSVGNVSIANGIVTLPSNCQFPLPDDGTFCVNLPIFAPVTATVIYNGTGSVEINATYEDGTTCPIFSAGVNSELNLHITQEVTLSCDPVCPPIPDCYVNVCLDFQDSGNDVFKITIIGVATITVQNGVVNSPNGQFPLVNGQFCIDLPVFNGGTTADLQFLGFGSAVVTATYPDLLECEVFSAGIGSDVFTNTKLEVTLTCEGECAPPIETCEIDLCVELSPNPNSTFSDSYVVTFASGMQLIIQNGTVTLPNGSVIPLIGNQFCATIEIEVGSFETAELSFVGAGQVNTFVTFEDGGNCNIFSAGTANNKIVKQKTNVTLGCDPIC